jgi:hypothetical protein
MNQNTNYISESERLVFFLVLRIFEFNEELIQQNREIIIKPIVENLKNENEERIRIRDYNKKNKINQVPQKKTNNDKCNDNWPVCVEHLETDRKEILPFFIMRIKYFPKIQEEYFEMKKNRDSPILSFKENYFRKEETESLINNIDSILLERTKHICSHRDMSDDTLLKNDKDIEILGDHDRSFELEEKRTSDVWEDDLIQNEKEKKDFYSNNIMEKTFFDDDYISKLYSQIKKSKLILFIIIGDEYCKTKNFFSSFIVNPLNDSDDHITQNFYK